MEELKQRIRRLPELTRQAGYAETVSETQKKISSIKTNVAVVRAQSVALRQVAAVVGPEDLQRRAQACCDNVNEVVSLASKLKRSISRSNLLPPSMDEQLQEIVRADTRAASEVKKLWAQVAELIRQKQSRLAAIAAPLGIEGAARLADDLAMVAGGDAPDSAERAETVTLSMEAAEAVLESLPQEGVVGSFLDKLVQGNGARLAELSVPEVSEFIEQHGLEHKLIVRLGT